MQPDNLLKYEDFPRLHSFQGIVPDVFADCVQFFFIPDDMFVIIALPDRDAGAVKTPIYGNGGYRFECPHNVAQCRGAACCALLIAFR